jgi:single-stranded DNA-specific DHH superfamily exonuclease
MSLTESQIKEIQSLLHKSEKPLFFFDDDPDGLSSFLLLYRWIKKGTGVLVKSTPKLDEKFLPKVEECRPDVVVILDKPMVEQSFIDAIQRICAPKIVWIDHHPLQKNTNIYYYNPRQNDETDNRPTNYWCWQVVKEYSPEDMWIAMTGCIGDWHLPDFTEQFCEKYSAFMKDQNITVEQALYETKIGKIARIFSFILKGPTKKAMNCVKILTRINKPEDILEQKTQQGKYIWKWFSEVNAEYQNLKKNVEKPEDNLLLFTYTEDKMSFTADLSNELLYMYPNKTILICRQKGAEMKCSIRDTTRILPSIINESLEGLTGYGGGHDHACGICVNINDFSTFLERMKKKL